jgi:hypothetical protein
MPFGSQACPVCKGKSPAPWRSIAFVQDGHTVFYSRLFVDADKGELRTDDSTDAVFFTYSVIFRADNTHNCTANEPNQVIKPGHYRFWKYDPDKHGCLACDGEHSAAAAMRRKMENLW